MADKKQTEFTVTDRRRFAGAGDTAPSTDTQSATPPGESDAYQVLERAPAVAGLPPQFLRQLAAKLGSKPNAASLVRHLDGDEQLRNAFRQIAGTAAGATAESNEPFASLSRTLCSYGSRLAAAARDDDAIQAFILAAGLSDNNPLAFYWIAKMMAARSDPSARLAAQRFLSFGASPSFEAPPDSSFEAMTHEMQEIVAAPGGDPREAPPTAEERQAQHDAFKESSRKLDERLGSNLGGRRAQDFEMNFERFIASLYMSALMQLGLMHEQGGQPQVDLIGARQTIDTIGLLGDKTKGNLTPAEDNMLQNCLYELRVAYVEVTNAIARGAQAPGAQPPTAGKGK